MLTCTGAIACLFENIGKYWLVDLAAIYFAAFLNLQSLSDISLIQIKKLGNTWYLN